VHEQNGWPITLIEEIRQVYIADILGEHLGHTVLGHEKVSLMREIVLPPQYVSKPGRDQYERMFDDYPFGMVQGKDSEKESKHISSG
jgi:hypothetical protein